MQTCNIIMQVLIVMSLYWMTAWSSRDEGQKKIAVETQPQNNQMGQVWERDSNVTAAMILDKLVETIERTSNKFMEDSVRDIEVSHNHFRMIPVTFTAQVSRDLANFIGMMGMTISIKPSLLEESEDKSWIEVELRGKNSAKAEIFAKRISEIDHHFCVENFNGTSKIILKSKHFILPYNARHMATFMHAFPKLKISEVYGASLMDVVKAKDIDIFETLRGSKTSVEALLAHEILVDLAKELDKVPKFSNTALGHFLKVAVAYSGFENNMKLKYHPQKGTRWTPVQLRADFLKQATTNSNISTALPFIHTLARLYDSTIDEIESIRIMNIPGGAQFVILFNNFKPFSLIKYLVGAEAPP